MLLVDKRKGSGELLPYLKHLGLDTEWATLPFGDFALLGRGVDGAPFPVGVERKTLGDFLQSMATGRLTTVQVPGLYRSFSEAWVVLEGRYRPDPMTGLLMVPGFKQKAKWKPYEYAQNKTGVLTWEEFQEMQLTVTLRCGCRIKETRSPEETCRFLKAVYRWWTAKDYDQHKSHLKLYLPTVDKALLLPPTVCRMVAGVLPLIGWDRSLAVAKHFGSVWNMVLAEEVEWLEIDGIGHKIASQVVKAIRTPGALL